LLFVVWVVVLDSESVLVVTNMLVEEDSSVLWKSGLDLESNSVLQWVSWEVWSSLVDVPLLVSSVVALPEDDVHVVSVLASVDIKAGSRDISDVSESSWVESKLLGGSTGESLGSSCNVSSESSVDLVTKSVGSSVVRSDGSGSVVHSPPLSLVPWGVVLDSGGVLVVTNMLGSKQGSVVSQSGSDLEWLSSGDHLSWPLNSSLVDVPGLVETVVAVPEDDMSVLSV
jgi:hypothetical protein